MITKTKKNVLIVLLALLFVVSLGAIGFMAVSAETTDVTLKGVGLGVNNGAKFVLATEDGTAVSVPSNATNQEGKISQDTENSYFDKIVFNLTNENYSYAVGQQYTFEELHSANGNWNLHIGYDSVNGDTSTIFIGINSGYAWAEGDRITLLDGLHVMTVEGGALVYTDYVLSGNVTVVYDNGTFRVLEEDEAYDISLNRSRAAIGIEGTVQLTADVIESIKDTPLTVEWASDHPEIATVENGTVTGVSVGVATITATVGDVSASCEITVADSTVIQLSGAPSSIEVDGEPFTVTAEVNDTSSITWSAAPEGIVELEPSGMSVVVTPVGIGSVTITATANGGITASATESCTVAVGLSETSISIGVGDTYTVSAGTTSGITWTTSDEAVATVSDEGVITAVGNGDATITATAGEQSASVAVNVFTYTEFTFTSVTLAGSNNIHVNGYGAGTGNSYTNLENARSNPALSAFFDNFLVNDYTLNELYSQEGYENWNFNIHLFDTYISIYLFNRSGGNIAIPVGTEFTFKKGCVLPANVNNEWTLSQTRIAEDLTYALLDDNTFALVAEEGSTAEVTAISELEHTNYGYYEFRVTLDMLAYSGTTDTAADDTYSLGYILINGYTVSEINEANPDSGVEIYYSNRDIIIDIYEGTEMDGEPLVDTEGRSTYFTLKEGYQTPYNSYVIEDDYTKYYYGGQLRWWSDAYTGKPESSQTIEIASISTIETDGDGNTAFTITFTEDVFSPTVHINGVPSWQNTTPYADQIDGQLTTGVKEAVWYGISVDGKTVYQYMFESGQGNDTNQSTAVQVHFDSANTLRIVFQGNLNAGFDTSAASHTVAFDADVFYSNTGASFAMDTLWSYDTASETWTDETAITGIAFGSETASVEVGGTVTVTATVTGGTAADTSVTYTSSDTSIATVDEDGVVTGVAVGTVTITATAADGSTATCTVTVTAKEEPENPGTGENPGEDPGTGENPGTGEEGESGGGCSGSIATGMAVLSAVLLGGAVVCVLAVKRKN